MTCKLTPFASRADAKRSADRLPRVNARQVLCAECGYYHNTLQTRAQHRALKRRLREIKQASKNPLDRALLAEYQILRRSKLL